MINVDVKVMQDYYKLVTNAQFGANGRADMKFPKLPKTDTKTTIALKAYLNMASTWNKAGGCVPKLTEELCQLLYIMGTNKLMFKRKSIPRRKR